MDTEKHPPQGQAKNSSEQKPIIDQMTDLAANAAGVLAETAVKTVADKAKKAAARRIPKSVKKVATTVANAAAKKKAVNKGTKKK